MSDPLDELASVDLAGGADVAADPVHPVTLEPPLLDVAIMGDLDALPFGMHRAISGGELLSPIDRAIFELNWLEMQVAVSRKPLRLFFVSITFKASQYTSAWSIVLQID